MNMAFVSDRPGVALLIDGDNLPATYAGKLITLACKLGPLEIRRVYADARKRVDWCEAPGFNLIHAGCGKNAADILLAEMVRFAEDEGDWLAGFADLHRWLSAARARPAYAALWAERNAEPA